MCRPSKPPQPPGFNNRLNANWKLLLQIAQHAGGSWPEQACRSATYLSRAPYEPSVGVQLLAALRATFTKNRTEITSKQVVQLRLACAATHRQDRSDTLHTKNDWGLRISPSAPTKLIT